MALRPTIFIFLLCALLSACGDTPTKHMELTSQSAYASAISPDGKYALVGSVQHGSSLWRLKDEEKLYNWNHGKGELTAMSAVTFSTDSRFALTADKKRLVMWDVSNGKPQGFWSASGGVLALALSDDGRYALVGQEDYSAIYIETKTGSILQKVSHSGDINTVAISANGKIGATGSEDGTVKVWDLTNGKVMQAFKIGDDISTVAISRDGNRVFGGLYYGTGKIWNTRTGKEISTIGYPRITLSAGRFSSDGKKLITGDTVRRVMIWNVKSGKKITQRVANAPSLYPPSGLIVEEVSLLKNGTISAIYSNGSVNIWDNKKG